MPATPLDKVLALRPTNVVMRLGAGSRLPLLNPRDLVAAGETEAAPLICVPAYARSAAEGALKAARDQDSVIGIACPFPLADRDTPGRFVETVCAGAEEVRHRKPFFLQAGPFRMASPEDRLKEQLAAAIFRYVDAGFTLISLDASRLPAAQAAASYLELAQPALERELSIEVTAPVDDLGRLDADALREVLQTLVTEGASPHFVRVPGSTYALEAHPTEAWALDLSVLAEAKAVASEFRVAVAIESEGTAPETLSRAWLEAGVRKVDPAEACLRAALSGWPKDWLDALGAEAAAAGVDRREVAARVEGSQPADTRAQLRAEAGTWALVMDLLPRVGATGSASRAVAFLARGGRY